MKRFLKWALVALAAVGCWVAIQQARQVAELPAVRQAFVTTQPGVTPDVIQVTYFSSDVRCATCVRIERLTRETVELNFGPARPGATEGLISWGLPGAFLLGLLFAVTFCPTSAALFFGSLLPLALTSPTQLPLFVIYGLATAVPVGIVALAVLVGASSGAKFAGGLQRPQKPLQTFNAWLIIAIGGYLTLTSSLRLF